MSLDPQRDADLLAALGDLGGPAPGERSDDDLIAGALAGLAEPRLVPMPPAEAELVDLRQAEAPRRAPIVIAFAAAAVALAAAVVLLVLRPAGLLGEADDDAPGSMAPAMHDHEDDGEVATERHAAAEPERKAVRRPEAVQSPAEPLDALDADTDGDLADDSVAPEDSGESGDPGEDERPRRRPRKPAGPDAMLARAQTLFGEGKTDQAVRAYESLIDRHPRSAEAKAARVSLGRIELSRGHADKALEYFDAYLAMSAGSLVQEARYGRIRALRKLGRTDAERRSIEAFLADYPKSVYAPRLDKRAAELGGP